MGYTSFYDDRNEIDTAIDWDIMQTKYWRDTAEDGDIKTGLTALVEEVQRLGIRSIAIPPLGCGNGGLDWAEVKPLILEAFKPLPHVEVIVFEPAGAPSVEARAIATSQPPPSRR